MRRSRFRWFPTAATGGPLLDVDAEYDPGRGIVYLWGVRDEHGRYRAFADWTGTYEGERTAFAEFWRHMRAHTTAGAVAYHYSHAETRQMEAVAARHAGQPGIPTRDESSDFVYSESWFDLYRFVDDVAWPAEDQSLKTLAALSGFRWRDDNPSGEASIAWYRQAVDRRAGPSDREAARSRILAYNEDDLAAMAALRSYALRRLGPPA